MLACIPGSGDDPQFLQWRCGGGDDGVNSHLLLKYGVSLVSFVAVEGSWIEALRRGCVA